MGEIMVIGVRGTSGWPVFQRDGEGASWVRWFASWSGRGLLCLGFWGMDEGLLGMWIEGLGDEGGCLSTKWKRRPFGGKSA